MRSLSKAGNPEIPPNLLRLFPGIVLTCVDGGSGPPIPRGRAVQFRPMRNFRRLSVLISGDGLGSTYLRGLYALRRRLRAGIVQYISHRKILRPPYPVHHQRHKHNHRRPQHHRDYQLRRGRSLFAQRTTSDSHRACRLLHHQWDLFDVSERRSHADESSDQRRDRQRPLWRGGRHRIEHRSIGQYIRPVCRDSRSLRGGQQRVGRRVMVGGGFRAHVRVRRASHSSATPDHRMPH
jgi:hypothetical protein